MLIRISILLMTAILAMPARADLPGPLIDAVWLAAHKDEVAIIDVRYNSATFAKVGHIPGAVFLGWHDIRVNRTEDGAELVGMLPEAGDFAALMRRAGIDDSSEVVIVNAGRHAGQVTFATRLYWQMKYFGHDAVALLDGGMAAWDQAGLPVSHDAPTPVAKGNFTVRAARRDLLATTDDVEAMIASTPDQLLDARGYGQYLGLTHDPRSVLKGGHIPGARYFPIDAFLSPGPVKSFLDPVILTKTIRGLGIRNGAVAYCNTGHFASGTWFLLHELAGVSGTRLYDGSLNEWLATGHPVVALSAD